VIRGRVEILGAIFPVVVDSPTGGEDSISSDCDDIEVAKDELVLINDNRLDSDVILSISSSELEFEIRRIE